MAQYPLFININDLKKYTNISGNIDADKLIPSIRTAQQLEIENILGTDLYEKISADILADTLTGDYLDLKTNYIHDTLIHFAVSYYLPYAAYSIANAGINKHTTENTTSIDNDELTFLVNKERGLAETYKKRLIKYLEANTAKFPEYNTNSGTDIQPTKFTNRTSWYLKKTDGYNDMLHNFNCSDII